MYLSKILLDPMHPSARQALRDRQDLHRNVTNAFPGRAAEETVLYRLIETRSELQLIVLSKDRPDEQAVAAAGGKLADLSDLSGLPDRYRAGAVLHFSLMASPSKKIKRNDGKNSRRVFIREPGDRAEWLSRQGGKYGFSVLECHEPSAAQKIRVGRKSGVFSLSAVEMCGTLRIDEPDLFWKSWAAGIGPEKAYGTGLMLLSK